MKHVITLLTIFIISHFSLIANDFEPLVNLSGKWKFNLGDDMAWAQKNYNDSDWDAVYAPGCWEDQGYVGYNGYAWYRIKVTVPATKHRDHCYLQLGKIDDVNQVYFNGVLIGQLGVFPPTLTTAYNAQVVYAIPEKLINFNGDNVIAVRVYDETANGGIVNGPLLIGYDIDAQLLSQDLAGTWRIAFKNYKGSLSTSYNDANWDKILVPASWESQGYNFDGYACYRKTFTVNSDLTDEKLYLIMGKIDDKDRVYLNGKLIGTTQEMYHTSLGNRSNGDWQIRRAYRIPSGLINKTGTNAIVVLVYDAGGIGGIHSGPIGLMTADQYEQYVDHHKSDNYYNGYYSFWDFIYNEFLR